MSDQTAIRVEGVRKTFRLPHEKSTSIKSSLVNSFKHNRSFEKQQVLDAVSFEVKQGEFFGIVGRNGSGKSTLLKLLAGIYSPDNGLIEINGKLTPFIELGVGFNPELTGRENVFLNGSLLGFNRREMLSMYDDIVKFAELERFMDQKLKNYSSGMQVRLAFSIAIKINSDILLLDEVLAVGDAAFQKKCFDFFRQLKKDKKTVVFISHDMNAVREYCDRAVLIEKGQIIQRGTPDSIADAYTRLFAKDQDPDQETASGQNVRRGSGDAKIVAVETKLTQEQLTITVACEFKKAISDPIFGLTIHSPVGTKIFESNTKWKRYATGDFKAKDNATIVWNIPNIFTNGKHTITPAIANKNGIDFYDNWEEAASFEVDKDDVTTAVTLPLAKVQINK